ncbi:MAG: AbrB/MazE/SpoVT family DNA-binding domain-containing protein [Nitrospira sp.]|nr:AbrB/MazE/SpoVT family DNA-binding domain-containing protein [Nitrospira sp.]
MKTRAQKWGNSLAVRVPKSVATQIELKAQDDLDIEVRDGHVVLKPQLHRVYRLDDLLRQITKKNAHSEVDSGGPVGRESW